jgi:hypothetical protein
MRTTTKRCALATLLAVLPFGASFAQNAAPPAVTRIIVQAIVLKPGKAAEWRALQKNDVLPALKKSGVAWRDTLETVFGNQQEVITLRPLQNFAEFDATEDVLTRALGAKAADALRAKLQDCTVSTQRYVIVRQDGLSITPGGAAGPIRVTTTFRVQPGEAPLYTDFLRGDVLPVMQQAKAAGKITGYGVSNAAQGSPEQGLRILTTYFANLAAYDAANANGGLAEQTVGAARAAQLGAMQAHLGQGVQVMIRRRIADLSY